MLIDTKQIVTMTDLRENLTEILMLVEKGEEMMVTDRGRLVMRLVPVYKEKSKPEKEFDVVAETRKLRKKISKKNPNFDSVKALREIRYEK
jgi:prevent-host-death family protein